MTQTILKDLRHALRGLLRQPAFTAIVVLTLAVGIGANTAIFSVVDGILLRHLGFENPDELVAVWADYTRRDGPANEWLSYPNYHDLRQLDQAFAEVGLYNDFGATLLSDNGETRQLFGAVVSEGMFNRVLRLTPAIGRAFSASDDVPEGERVALLSWQLWQEQWQGDPAIVGSAVRLDSGTVTVIGIMPEQFRPPFLPQAELWVPLRMDAATYAGGRGSAMFQSIGRLRGGVSLELARAEAAALGIRLEQEFPEVNTGVGYTINPLLQDMVGPTSTMLWVLLAAVAFVLLMACVNIANLLLAQASARRGELAVRAALGATRLRIVRQLLAESLVLALSGGGLGILLGIAGTRALVTLAPPGTPRIDEVTADARIMSFAVAVTLASALAFGLLPALRASRADLGEVLRDAGRGTDRSSGGRLRAGLVVAQVALAVVLLVGAGLLVRTFQQLNRVDLGFEPSGVLAVGLRLPPARYPDRGATTEFYRQLEAETAALPGVLSVGAIDSLPLGGFDGDTEFQIEGLPEPPPGEERIAWFRRITPGYATAIGLHLRAGRFFTSADDAATDRVAGINETLARRYFPGVDPIGRRIYFGPLSAETRFVTVIGVFGDVKNFGVAAESRNAIYFPLAQNGSNFMSLVVRSDGDPSLLAGPIRSVIAEMDGLLATSRITTMSDLVRESLASERFSTTLMLSFALVALVLAFVGLYGVLSYAVNLRSHEIGVRIALGAEAGDIGRLIIGGSLILIGSGLAIGLVGAFAGGRTIGGLLYGVEPTDPTTFIAVVGILLLAGVSAACRPTLRATRVDPVDVLGAD